MPRPLNIVAAAFGKPMSEDTQSGIAKRLFSAIARYATVIANVNTKQIRPWDVLEGAIHFSKLFKYGRPGINVRWIWCEKTLQKLNARFMYQCRHLQNIDAVLQVGTNICVPDQNIKHYCRTDMTIVQALQAKQFEAARLKAGYVDEAIETQHRIFTNCTGIFVVSHWTKQSIVNDYGISPTRIYVNGVGVSLNPDEPILEKKPGYHILFVGKDWYRKGGPLLLKAFKRVRHHIPQATLTIIGCRPVTLQRNVRILGYLDKSIPDQKKTFWNAFSQATLLCVPSRCEPFGICFLEAQSRGVVPVTFPGEGRSEAIQDGISGVLVKQRSPEALSEAILELLNSPERLIHMSRTGQETMRNHFTWDHIARKMIDVMQADQKEVLPK